MKKIKTVFGIFLMMLLVLWLTPAVNITAKAASYTSLQVDDHLAVYDQISYGSASLKFGNIEGLTELSSGTLTLRTGNYNSGTNSYTVAYSTDGNYYVFVDQANTVYGLSNRGAFKEDLSEGLEVQSVENGVITFAPYLPSHTLTYKYDSDNPQYPDYVVNDANKRSKALTSMPAGWIAPEGKVLCGWLFHNATWGETALGAPISITKDGIYATPLWVESYGLWVGDTAVTKNKKSDYGWSYDPDSNTLTLNNFFYSGVGHNDNAENPHYGGIYYDGEDPLKIQISGNNSIENTHTANLPCGIYSTKDVTINGTGTLEIVASSYTKSQGIWCDQAAFTQNSGNIVMRTTSNGIYAKKGAQINGGSLDVYGNYGITGDEKNYKLVIGSDVESVVISGEGKATDFPVINALKGTGWTDKDGTQGEADIEISTTGQALTYKKVQFLPAKSMATVVKEPTAKADLTENGSAQELVTAGTADGGTMQYALGTDAKTAPTDGYSTAIPTGTKAGNYYVWYKVAGDDSHKDSDPACIEVKIKETNNDSTIETKVEKKDDVPEANVEGLDSELAKSVMTDEEKAKVEAGDNVSLTLEMTNIDSSVGQEDKALSENAAKSENKNAQIGTYFDLSLLLKVGNSSRNVSSTGGKKLTFKLKVPEKYHAPKNVNRTFLIIRIHANKSEVLAKTKDTTIPFSSSEFSTYALAYYDEVITGFYPGVKISQKNGKITVSWDKVESATKYAVYATYCGKDMPKKASATVKTNKATIKKIGGKKINFSKNFKLYVIAYDSSGNELGKSVSAHFAGKDSKKYKNPKDIKLSTKTISISAGGTANIKATVKMESGKKKALSEGHAAKLRYASSDISVATVDKSGKVTGVNPGTCTVYVYAQNGLAKKVSVTIK